MGVNKSIQGVVIGWNEQVYNTQGWRKFRKTNDVAKIKGRLGRSSSIFTLVVLDSRVEFVRC